MSYDLKTVQDVMRAIKQNPHDLQVLLHLDGMYYPLNEIRSCYVLPTTDWTHADCFHEVDENTKGSTQIVLID